MKRSLAVLMSAFAVLGAAPLAAAELKVGVVDLQRLMSEAPQARAAEEALRTEFGPKQKDLETRLATLQAREQQLTRDAATMTELQRSAVEKELRDGYRDLQRIRDEIEDDYTARRDQEQSKLNRALLEEVANFARSGGYDLVLSDGVLFAVNALNVTGPVLQALQNRRAGAPAAAPARPATTTP